MVTRDPPNMERLSTGQRIALFIFWFLTEITRLKPVMLLRRRRFENQFTLLTRPSNLNTSLAKNAHGYTRNHFIRGPETEQLLDRRIDNATNFWVSAQTQLALPFVEKESGTEY
jgi:hypothetical protein